MAKVIRIGTRESQLAVWQAESVQQLLSKNNYDSQLVFIKSEGDADLHTPLYEMGVMGVFTKTLDIALLNHRIDIAVHSMKDVPTRLAKGIVQAAVLKRASYKDILVFKGDPALVNDQLSMINGELPGTTPSITDHPSPFTIATSSIRRKAQWLNRYPNHIVENIRGNVNTRLRKLQEHPWNGAIFAAAGLERIGLRPENSLDLDWMLPAPAQGAIMVVCREEDDFSLTGCRHFNHTETEICTTIERDFLKALQGGCSTPISALARVNGGQLLFRGNILSIDGKEKVEIEKISGMINSNHLGKSAAEEILTKGADSIAHAIRNAK